MPRLTTHRTCNQAYSEDEEYFRDKLLYMAEDTPAARALLSDHRRSLQRSPTKAALLNADVTHITPGGLELPAGRLGMRYDGKRVDRVLWKVARGLIFGRTGEVFASPPPQTIDVFPMAEFIRRARSALNLAPFDHVRAVPGAFEYYYLQAEREDERIRTLILVFMNTVVGYVTLEESLAPKA